MKELEERVSALLDEGLPGLAIAKRVGVSHSTVSRTAARMGRRLAPARGSQFDWDAIRRYYERGHTRSRSVVAGSEFLVGLGIAQSRVAK